MLSSDELAVLDFERSWWLRPGPKDQAIEFWLGLSAASYYEMLRELLDNPAALQRDPLTVRRLKAIIERGDQLNEAMS